MRRPPTSRRYARYLGTLAVALGLGGLARPLRAQGGIANAGGLELVLPVGAQANGLGQAVVADYLGSESVWWNPGALAREHTREAAIHHSTTFAVTGDAITLVVPAAAIGVVGLSVDLYNYGTQDVTDATGTYGTITPRATIFAATFASAVTSHVDLGLNYKIYQSGINCSGGCAQIPTQTNSTTALDFGVQIRPLRDSSLWIGAALRNVGPRLQVNDAPQADRLPTRLDLGVTYAPHIPSLSPDAQLRFGADIVNAIPATGPGLRFGADLGWQQKVHVRAGYVYEGPGGSGPTMGFGASTGRLTLDIARLFDDNVASTGQAPTYLSLRLTF
jgi:hypothetical protein